MRAEQAAALASGRRAAGWEELRKASLRRPLAQARAAAVRAVGQRGAYEGDLQRSSKAHRPPPWSFSACACRYLSVTAWSRTTQLRKTCQARVQRDAPG